MKQQTNYILMFSGLGDTFASSRPSTLPSRNHSSGTREPCSPPAAYLPWWAVVSPAASPPQYLPCWEDGTESHVMGTDHFMGTWWKIESRQKWDYEHRILKCLRWTWRFAWTICHLDFPDRNVYIKSILSNRKFYTFYTHIFTSSLILFGITANQLYKKK